MPLIAQRPPRRGPGPRPCPCRPSRRTARRPSAARGEVRRAEQRQQHRAGVHAALRQAVARARVRGARRRARRGGAAGGAASRSWTIASLVSARGRDPGDLARRRRRRPLDAMSPSSVTRPMTAAGRPQRRQTAATSARAVGPDDREHPLLRLARSSPRTAPCPARAAGSRRGRSRSRCRRGRRSRRSRR